MKKLIPFFIILIGCDSNHNEVTLTKEEYKKLKGDTIKPEYPKPFKLFNEWNHSSHIVLGSDGHEYIEIVLKHRIDTYNVLHSPECIKCMRIDTNSVTNQ